MEYQHILDKSKSVKKANKKLVARLKKDKPKKLDQFVHQADEEAFEEIDCLKCANCCKTTSPGMKERDIDRLSQGLNMKPSKIIEKYMVKDNDGDYVFKSAPCPFLGDDNYCSVYEHRPNACREYPHTNRKRFHQLLDLSLKNTLICPAVAVVFEKMREEY